MVREAGEWEHSNRRAGDMNMAERVTRIESKMDSIESSLNKFQDRNEKNIERIHERVDDILKQIGDVKANVSSMVDDAIHTHTREEKDILDFRFNTIEQKIDKQQQYAEKSEKLSLDRIKLMQEGFREIKILAAKAFFTLLTGLAISAGYIIMWLWNHSAVVDAVNNVKTH